MTQRDLYRAVAHATGESMSTISQTGFVLLRRIPVEREPLTVDWDSLDLRRLGFFPQRACQKRCSAWQPVSRISPDC